MVDQEEEVEAEGKGKDLCSVFMWTSRGLVSQLLEASQDGGGSPPPGGWIEVGREATDFSTTHHSLSSAAASQPHRHTDTIQNYAQCQRLVTHTQIRRKEQRGGGSSCAREGDITREGPEEGS